MRRWGFHRIETTEQRSKGLIIFTCPRFRRGRPDMCKRMCDDRQYKAKTKPATSGGLASLADLSAGSTAPAGLYFNGTNPSLAAGQGVATPVAVIPGIPIGYYNPMMFNPFGAASEPMIMSGHGFGNPMLGGAAAVGGVPMNPNPNEVRSNIARIEAELATLSRMRVLQQQSLSMAAMRNQGQQQKQDDSGKGPTSNL